MLRRGLICFILTSLFCFDSIGQENVLVIIADDLGVDYIGQYNLGSDPAPTPVLDSLADNGILFTNAWTNPICSPSRANILTGKYGFRTGIGTAITGLDNATLDTSEYTLPKAVRAQAGVSTAMFGKWHLGHSSQAFRRNPNACGFDHYSGNVEGQLPNYSLWQKTENGANTIEFAYATTVTVNDAIDWVDDQTGDWFMCMTFNAPHVPFHKPPNWLHSFDSLPGAQAAIDANPIPYFKAMVEAMDTEIGRFLNHLRSLGELSNTHIIFIGDNGTDGEVVQLPFDNARAKATMYNGGVHVPLIISSPSVVVPGREADELVNSTDIYHTVVEILGGSTAAIPPDAATDSRSFMPVIVNASDSENQRSFIYGDLFKPTTNFKDGKAITDGDYKLIEFDNGTTEFYRISTDLHENNPIDIGSLNAQEQERYEFLCDELSSLLDTNFCQITTAVLENQLKTVELFPNPVIDDLYLGLQELDKGRRLTGRIYSNTGQLVQTVKLVDLSYQVISVRQLPPGTYRVVVSNGKTLVASSSFVKQ